MAEPTPAAAARRLIRHARSGVLATVTPDGAPFASLVTPATAPDLSPLLWLSRLARHTQNLAADPRCSLLLAGPAAGPNPQTAPRVTILGTAAPVADEPVADEPVMAVLRARWLALHPYALPYTQLRDFALWRLTIAAAHFVAGFAATARLTAAELLAEPRSAADLAAAEPGILAHCNAEHGDALNAIALNAIAGAAGGVGTSWRLVSVDVDGCHLAQGEAVLRIDFAGPLTGPGGVRAELVRLARAARESARPD